MIDDSFLGKRFKLKEWDETGYWPEYFIIKSIDYSIKIIHSTWYPKKIYASQEKPINYPFDFSETNRFIPIFKRKTSLLPEWL